MNTTRKALWAIPCAALALALATSAWRALLPDAPFRRVGPPLARASSALAQSARQEHDEDEHAASHDSEGHTAAAGHDPGDAHDDHDDHAARPGHGGHGGHTLGHVEITPAERERLQLELQRVEGGVIARELSFPGEIQLDPDRLVHVLPRAAGVVREVHRRLGERVVAGEVLAWIESAELAEAKLAYYSAQAAVGLCALRLPRAHAIFDNTAKLRTLLAGEPTPTEIAALDGLEMGAYRGKLLTAAAALRAARQSLARERRLLAEEITSTKEVLAAETAYEQAQAQFDAAMDTARFETLIAFSDAARARQVAEFEAVAAEQRLRLKGADDALIHRLRELVPDVASLEPCTCDDPQCTKGTFPSVLETLGQEERFAWAALRAPLTGHVVRKHLTLGELVSGEEPVFTIADTSSVWVTFDVYQKDIARVAPGQPILVEVPGSSPRAGRLDFLSPLVDEQTRTAQARAVLENGEGALRPGVFVTVGVRVAAAPAEVVIPRAAVQVVSEETVVFVPEGDDFRAVEIELGEGDREHVAITEGLEPGTEIVVRGAFELKAKMATAGLGAHAGHGH